MVPIGARTWVLQQAQRKRDVAAPQRNGQRDEWRCCLSELSPCAGEPAVPPLPPRGPSHKRHQLGRAIVCSTPAELLGKIRGAQRLQLRQNCSEIALSCGITVGVS